MPLPFFPQPKPGTKLADKTAEKRDDEKRLAKMRGEVWSRDKGQCQVCARKVIRTISLVPERGEVHHLRGRRVAPEDRYRADRAVLLCAACHIEVTEKRVMVKPNRKGKS